LDTASVQLTCWSVTSRD